MRTSYWQYTRDRLVPLKPTSVVLLVTSILIGVDTQIDGVLPDIVRHIRIINKSTDVGVSRTGLSLDDYHCQVIILAIQITVLLLIR